MKKLLSLLLCLCLALTLCGTAFASSEEPAALPEPVGKPIEIAAGTKELVVTEPVILSETAALSRLLIEEGGAYDCKAVIIACGVQHRHLGIFRFLVVAVCADIPGGDIQGRDLHLRGRWLCWLKTGNGLRHTAGKHRQAQKCH